MDTKKRVDVFALSIYGLVIFPKAPGHIDDAVSDLFGRLDKRFVPVTQGLAQCEFAYKGDNYKKKKLQVEKMKKGENKAEEDLNSLKTDYKKLRLSIRTTGLGKTLEQ
ncbi:hypothetical protein Goklo_001149, partial [Gossypium klotzschianum]|nr:hypothetical protein [Gossypium klotzschianum]